MLPLADGMMYLDEANSAIINVSINATEADFGTPDGSCLPLGDMSNAVRDQAVADGNVPSRDVQSEYDHEVFIYPRTFRQFCGGIVWA